ncbi:PREDICTED: protein DETOXIFICATION 53-like [Camelina sativa]|uniref:Protein DETOXIFICATION n=1 Tax=Camelina sativa TaxID=90675 RepID=A0ABM0YXU3_CAMSA|nr:PREDICTED: protein DETOXIFICATION 53-like [Camelina sativa]
MQVGEEMASLTKIACPIVMTSLLIFSRSIISMWFLSHLGKVELAGGALAMGFGNITGVSVLKGLSVGMDPICGQAFGAKRWTVLSHTFQKMFCLLIVVSIPIAFAWLNIEPIFLKLGQDPDITKVAKIYMLFFVPELLAQAMLHPLRTFLRTQGLTSPLTISAIVSILLHPVFNYVFVVRMRLGVKGVAIAMAFNTMNINVGLLVYTCFSDSIIKPWEGLALRSLFRGWWPLLSLAAPSAISVCLEYWWYEIMLFLCGLLGNPKASVAAMGILIQTTGILYVVPFAISSAIATRVGHALGGGQPTRAQCTTVIGLILAVAYGLAAAVFVTALRSVWGKMFTDEPEILGLISSALPILGLCEIGNSPQTAACGVLTGTARPKDGARVNLCAFYIVGLPVAVTTTFGFKVGFRGLWFGLLAAQMTCLVMMLYTLIRTDWSHQVKRAEELTSAAADKSHSEEETVHAEVEDEDDVGSNDLEIGLLQNTN